MTKEEMFKLVNDLKEKVNRAPSDKENIQKMVEDVLASKEKERISSRKAKFDVDDDESGFVSLQKRVESSARTPEDRMLQKFNDDILITSVILKTHPHSLGMWRKFRAGTSELKKALDVATSGEGAEWIPTGFSADIVDQVRLELKVANLFQTIVMPMNPYKVPVVSSDATGYLQSESIADEAQKLRASTPGTTNLELSAIKLAARVLFSEEISEDSIVPVLPWLKNNMITSLATAEEKAIINGDTSSTHQDSNVTAAYDAQKAWNGLRKSCLSAAKVDCSSFNLDTLRSIRKAMGKYGTDPKKGAWVVSVSGYIQLLSLKDSQNNIILTTVDRYGPNATVLSGELGRFDGAPVIVSEYVYDNLNNSGVYDGSTATDTIVLYVYVPGWVIGDRRRVSLRSAIDIETDQQILVVTQRKDFHSFYNIASEKVVGIGYNITA